VINLQEVGARPRLRPGGGWDIHFGLYLPGIRFPNYRVRVRVIHERDQFVRGIEPQAFDLWWRGGPYDLWDLSLTLQPGPGHFGEEGQYIYRFQLMRGEAIVAFWFADPFGLATATGNLSAFTIDSHAQDFTWTDANFRVPEVDRMVVYELHVGEFNGSFRGIIDQLDYLRGFGVNVLELMPVTNVKEEVEWGYTPLGFFTPDERFGGPADMKKLVNACHAAGIAVLVDAVYAHAHPEFAYNLVYEAAGEPNPMMGWFEGEFFSRPGMDYRKPFTGDYFTNVNRHWLDEYHVDGFRYDYVPGFYDGPVGTGYAKLVFDTYQMSRGIPRFQAATNRSLIIQCAEHLPDPIGILSQTYSNTCWQNGLLDRTDNVAWGGSLVDFAHQLDPHFLGYPSEYRNPGGDTLPVAPFQYFESHDHGRLISRIAPGNVRDLLDQPFGDRDRFYRLQPYVIALYTAKGIPMLWHGQEFAENWNVPPWGPGRNLYSRPLHWEYFYDPEGKALIRLYRIMGILRREKRCLNSRGFFYYYDEDQHRRQGVVVFRRHADAGPDGPEQDAIVILNFWDRDANIWVPFPRAGRWQEQIDQLENPRPPIDVAQPGEWKPVRVPSNFGSVYFL
jgi:1,4-alpha-glucan branching enzyme